MFNEHDGMRKRENRPARRPESLCAKRCTTFEKESMGAVPATGDRDWPIQGAPGGREVAAAETRVLAHAGASGTRYAKGQKFARKKAIEEAVTGNFDGASPRRTFGCIAR